MSGNRTGKSRVHIKGIQHFDRIVSRFKAQRASGIQYLAFLRDLSDNDSRWEKYRDSFGGKVIHLAIITIENSLILFCSRLWDEAPDALSIPNALLSAQYCIKDISDRHRLDLEGMSVPYDPHRFGDKLKEIESLHEAARALQARSVIRVMRSESLAHLLSDSRDRSAAFATRDEYENHGVTRNDLFEFADQTLNLVDEIIFLQCRTTKSYREQIDHFQSDVRKFWDALPILREVEE